MGSECATEAGFVRVRGALGRNYTAGSNDPHPRRVAAPWGPPAPSSSGWGDESDMG